MVRIHPGALLIFGGGDKFFAGTLVVLGEGMEARDQLKLVLNRLGSIREADDVRPLKPDLAMRSPSGRDEVSLIAGGTIRRYGSHSARCELLQFIEN